MNRARQALADQAGAMPAAAVATAQAGCVVFFAIGEDGSRARVASGRGADIEAAWRAAAEAIATQAMRGAQPPQRLRAEIVDKVVPMRWGELKARLAQTKRNYFNEGIAFDANFEFALLAQEMHGSAVLYNGDVDHAEPNTGNLRLHTRRRFGRELDFPSDDAAPVWCFTTRAVYVDANGAWPITAEGQAAGFRELNDWSARQVHALIDDAGNYLAEQVKPTGEFHYGWFPCFDRTIPTYNTLRHASSTYAMLEAWELTRNNTLKAAIDRSLAFLTGTLIRPANLPDGTRAAYLLDIGSEIKLGGNAVCLLALVKYTELTGDEQYLPLLEQLALGIRHMQDAQTGSFVHVLNAPALDVKDRFRVIYYDGEAAFGLMRLYGLTRDARWLAVVEKAFEHFIAAEHWRAHDHWLSYCVNELTRYRPELRYYRFGLQNVAGYLDFVLERITTFPTLLELMMAAREMVLRLEADPELRPLLAGLDRDRFDRALEYRARYLANGHFWPELAMFFRNPARIAGSFFIKHHSFRVRIDDVEHYLSGYVAYHRMLKAAEASAAAAADAVGGATGTVAWGGDVNLSRRQHYRLKDLGGAHRMLGDIAALREADLRIVNLECVVATVGEQGVDKDETGPYYYRARPEMLTVLTEAGIGMVATANNHSGDYGPEALMEQHALLQVAGIAQAGTGRTLEAALRPAFRRAGGVRVALFSLDATQPSFAATATRAGAAWLPLEDPAAWTATLAPRIEAARREADVVLVAVHWGANLETEPSPAEIAVGHAIVDAGADAVLGTSAHVLQGIEIHKGRPILHDAGDLLFDSVRNDFADSGVFTLKLSARGVEEVRFTPVGVGFGFSRQLEGDEARALSERFAAQCLALGTRISQLPDGRCAVRLSPPERPAFYADPAGVGARHVQPVPAIAPLPAPRPNGWSTRCPRRHASRRCSSARCAWWGCAACRGRSSGGACCGSNRSGAPTRRFPPTCACTSARCRCAASACRRGARAWTTTPATGCGPPAAGSPGASTATATGCARRARGCSKATCCRSRSACAATGPGCRPRGASRCGAGCACPMRRCRCRSARCRCSRPTAPAPAPKPRPCGPPRNCSASPAGAGWSSRRRAGSPTRWCAGPCTCRSCPGPRSSSPPTTARWPCTRATASRAPTTGTATSNCRGCIPRWPARWSRIRWKGSTRPFRCCRRTTPSPR
ncbi:CapA family protein [Variovorax sp. UC74_104]|uniref:CapA family protein n=1 Tax=Variovorax sp. UC74_104 TaxID=3374555 RepID=UPI003757C415